MTAPTSKFGKVIEVALWIAALAVLAENRDVCCTPLGNPEVPH